LGGERLLVGSPGSWRCHLAAHRQMPFSHRCLEPSDAPQQEPGRLLGQEITKTQRMQMSQKNLITLIPPAALKILWRIQMCHFVNSCGLEEESFPSHSLAFPIKSCQTPCDPAKEGSKSPLTWRFTWVRCRALQKQIQKSSPLACCGRATVVCPFPPRSPAWSQGDARRGGCVAGGVHGTGAPGCPHATGRGGQHCWYAGTPAAPCINSRQWPSARGPSRLQLAGGKAGQSRDTGWHSSGPEHGAGLGAVPRMLPRLLHSPRAAWLGAHPPARVLALQPLCLGGCCSSCPQEGAAGPGEQFSGSCLCVSENQAEETSGFGVPQAAGQQCPRVLPA